MPVTVVPAFQSRLCLFLLLLWCLCGCPLDLSNSTYAMQPSVRKQHNAGFKHKANVRAYYLQFEQQETEDMLEKKMAANMALAMQHGPGFAGPGGIPRPRAGLVRPPAGMPPAGMPPAGMPAAGLNPPMAGMRPVPNMPPPGMAHAMPPPGHGGHPRMIPTRLRRLHSDPFAVTTRHVCLLNPKVSMFLNSRTA